MRFKTGTMVINGKIKKAGLDMEKSAELIRLGVDPIYASERVAATIHEEEYSDPRHPVFTLADLMTLLPKWIKHRNKLLWLNIWVDEWSDKWCAAYCNSDDMDEADTFQSSEELVDCLYLLIKCLITEKFAEI